ncbi:hypothetical protein L7F22_033135 [Adiantum nelumboides]|nr:hypothetical protein [Adiantum nelumboides]
MSDRSDTSDWHALSPDLQERILLLLPVSSAVRAAGVCKSWRAIMASPSFSTQLSLRPTGKRPWFFLWGINELIHTRSAAFGFDPMAGCWFRLRTLRPPDFNRASLAGTNGAFVAFSGSKVCFTQTPTNLRWKETAPAMYSRCSALLGTIGSPCSASFKFIAFGGIIDDDDRNLEIYDACSNTWELCDPIPEGTFLDGISSHWMSSAILGCRFFVANYDGYLTSFDTDTKSWSEVQKLSITGLVSVFIVTGDSGLFALCVCRGQMRECLRMFEVDVVTMECKEVSQMPHELFSLFEDTDDQKGASLKCVGSGTLVYVYSEQYYKGYPVCMCDLSEGSFVWKQLPSLPSPPRFDRVVCCSTAIFPRDCFQVS